MRGDSAHFFHRLRLPVLLFFAAFVLWGAIAAPQPAPLALAAAALGGFLAAYARLRQVWLALAAVLAPLPGIFWFGQSAYALSLAFAILMAADYSDALLKEQNPYAALLRTLPSLAGALLLAGFWSLHAPVQLPALLASAAVTALCLPPLALSIAFSEEAIVRGNRQREKLHRLFAWFGLAAEPRWSISLSGVGLVLAVLGYFQIAAKPSAFDWLSALLAGALLFVFTRDLYAALAAAAAGSLLLLFSGAPGGALLLFLLVAIYLERNSGAFRLQGEGSVMAARRAMEERGSAILFAGLAAVVAAGSRGGGLAALHAVCGLVAALVFFPAFAGALRRIFPARRSIEEIYGTNAP